jgi:hypothetical protein
MASPAPAQKSTKLRIAFSIVITVIIFCATGLLVCLAMDAFTIPYLTPFAHFLAIIFSPIRPFLAPLTLGAFLKVCQHETFPRKKVWMFITGGWCLNHVQRVWKDVARLYSFIGEGGDRRVEFCGLNECRGDWVEAGLLVLVCLGQWRGWRWDFGVVERWVEAVVKQAKVQEGEKRRKAASADVERGDVANKVDEKKGLVVEEEVVGGDMEKTGLLVEVEENVVDKA